MKKFYEDVRGMLPDSSEYNEIRNNAYWELHWLSKEKIMKEQSTVVYEANEDTIEFILITIPESYESFEVFNILWYF